VLKFIKRNESFQSGRVDKKNKIKNSCKNSTTHVHKGINLLHIRQTRAREGLLFVCSSTEHLSKKGEGREVEEEVKK
jgi:hypothetical protein